MNVFEGNLEAKGQRFAIVASRFNDFIVEKLVSGARGMLGKLGVGDDAVDLYWVPGAYEIPPVAARTAQSGKYQAVICLGAVIRGATPHFDYVAGEAARGIAQVARSSAVPVIFGVLTTDTIEQAIERAGTKAGNKGAEAAAAAVEMANLYRQMGGVKSQRPNPKSQ